MQHHWGVDLGGTKTELAVFTIKDSSPSTIFRKRVATPAKLGPEAILGTIVDLVETATSELEMEPTKIGLCHPGVIDPDTNLMRNSNTTCLNGYPFGQELCRLLPIPISFANDANCFALAEAKLGAARTAHTTFGVILGTGVGGGVVINGELLYGLHGIAGEWGHNPLAEDGDLCFCGRSGCIETVISGTALERYFENRAGIKLPLKEIAQSKDPIASDTIERLVTYLAKALGTVINIFDPEVVVVGGGVGNLDCIYRDVPPLLAKYCMHDKVRTRLVAPSLGDSAGVFGAGLLPSTGSQD